MIKKLVDDVFPNKLGCNINKKGANFSLFSAHAEKVELCFFDHNHKETQRIALPFVHNNIWHGVVSNVLPGDFYGYRVYGPWEPKKGLRFNHHKLLLDPYAKKISHIPTLEKSFYAFNGVGADADLMFDSTDSATKFPKAVVNYYLDKIDIKRPNIPWSETVIYELHTKGFSILDQEIPQISRGKLSALRHPAVIKKLKSLGITAVKIMPTQIFISEQKLVDKKLTNYWGYNPLNFFIVHPAYGENDAQQEFIKVTKELHQHDIEVIVDLVFNHTAEVDHLGPNLSFRGIDNKSYYILEDNNPRYYKNYSGCGNVIKTYHPQVARMIIDALESWADMGIDGIRFDLGSLLAIQKDKKFDANHALFFMIAQNPKLNGLKIISEPWDLGGHHLGQFPTGWAELNDYFRDNAKKSLAGISKNVHNFAHLLAGTDSLFSKDSKNEHFPVNYIAGHDGMSMLDLVSYSKKNNIANLEDNKDGPADDYSINYGVEGPTEENIINYAREEHIKNFFLITLASQGIPFFKAGDEIGHTQLGNSNPFCQDNKINWINWELANNKQDLRKFVSRLCHWRRQNKDFFAAYSPGQDFRNIDWFLHSGEKMQPADWHNLADITIGALYSLEKSKKAIYILVNLSQNSLNFNFPQIGFDVHWKLEFLTNSTTDKVNDFVQPPGSIYIWNIN